MPYVTLLMLGAHGPFHAHACVHSEACRNCAACFGTSPVGSWQRQGERVDTFSETIPAFNQLQHVQEEQMLRTKLTSNVTTQHAATLAVLLKSAAVQPITEQPKEHMQMWQHKAAVLSIKVSGCSKLIGYTYTPQPSGRAGTGSGC